MVWIGLANWSIGPLPLYVCRANDVALWIRNAGRHGFQPPLTVKAAKVEEGISGCETALTCPKIFSGQEEGVILWGL